MIFIDTGAFLARYLTRDQHHEAAIAGWAALQRTNRDCCTSNFVLDELFTLLGRRAGFDFASQRARAIYASDALRILRPDQACETKAIALMERYADQRISFTDCVSFQLMHSNRLSQFFGFDHHFELAGFERWPVASV